MRELWKPVAGYEGIYEVSSYGRVRSLKRVVNGKPGQLIPKKGIILKQSLLERGGGYYRVMLSKNNKGKHFLVHRLVAEAFIPNPDGLPVVNHKDICSLNNFVYVNPDNSIDPSKSNLEWCTIRYNSIYGDARAKAAEKCRKKIVATSNSGNTILFNSRKEAAKYFSVAPPTIGSAIYSEKEWRGWRFRYCSYPRLAVRH